MRDSIYANPLGQPGDFRFDQAVVDVFPDMLDRSIPGYASIISQGGLLAGRLAQPDTCLYDLGCSLGATSLSLRAGLVEREQLAQQSLGCAIVGIDSAPAMVSRCRDVIATADNNHPEHAASTPITVEHGDITTTAFKATSVVALNFTLQFVPPEARTDLLQRIGAALLPGGALILSEKITFDDTAVNDLHIASYHDFKRANGYSDLEISQKRTALENVLVPDTLTTHEKRLRAAGFQHIAVWFQCFNFASLVAIKAA